jgi:hypothetical protein
MSLWERIFGTQDNTPIDIAITTALAAQDYDKADLLASQFMLEFVKTLPREQLLILKQLDSIIAPRFLATRLMTAFFRGWRPAQASARLANAASEMRVEVDFLLSHKPPEILSILSHRINEYFCDAVWVFVKTSDPSTRLAAFCAAVVADSEQRRSMVGYLTAIASDWQVLAPATPEAATRLHDLARDIASQDWSLEDVVDQKARLHTADREYLYALDGSDPTIFRHRFSELFPKD